MAEFKEPEDRLHQRGYAVLITNKYFPLIKISREAYPLQEISDPTRGGADDDDMNLQYIFDTKLKFQLLDNRTYKNVNKYPYKSSQQNFWIHDMPEELEPSINKAQCKCLSCRIQTTDHSNSDCFVLAISTHGVQVDREQEICFSDDFHVHRVTLSDVIDTLSDENCKTLKGKPRIIILNLCRSDPDVPKEKQDEVWHDRGDMVKITENDDIGQQFQKLTLRGGADNSKALAGREGDYQCKDGPKEIEDTDVYKLDVENENDEITMNQSYYYGTEKALRNLPSNFLIVFPTVSGKKTFHNFQYGSWLIHELRTVVEQFNFNENPFMNFLSVLTATAGRVARYKESEKGYKTAVCFVHRLLQPIIFQDVKDSAKENPDLKEDKPASLFK